MYKQCENCDEQFSTHPDDYKCRYCGSYSLTEGEEERPRTKMPARQEDE